MKGAKVRRVRIVPSRNHLLDPEQSLQQSLRQCVATCLTQSGFTISHLFQGFPASKDSATHCMSFSWWTLLGSNQRPFPCQGNALTN